MAKTQTARGGPVRKDGTARRPMLLDPATGKKVRDNPSNRRRLKMPPHPDDVTTAASAPPIEKTDMTGDDAARIAMGGGGPSGMMPQPDGLTTGLQPEKLPVDYMVILNIVNTVISSTAPQAAMTEFEKIAIGAPLGEVMQKHFPGFDPGPELALAVALTAYLIRVLMAPPAVENLNEKAEAQAVQTDKFKTDPIRSI